MQRGRADRARPHIRDVRHAVVVRGVRRVVGQVAAHRPGGCRRRFLWPAENRGRGEHAGGADGGQHPAAAELGRGHPVTAIFLDCHDLSFLSMTIWSSNESSLPNPYALVATPSSKQSAVGLFFTPKFPEI